jgi:hypothetical protein
MALWAGIAGPVPGLTTMSVWIPSFHADAKPCWRKAALCLVSSSLALISFTCSHASLSPFIELNKTRRRKKTEFCQPLFKALFYQHHL